MGTKITIGSHYNKWITLNKYSKSLGFLLLDNFTQWDRREKEKEQDLATLKPHLLQFLGSSFSRSCSVFHLHTKICKFQVCLMQPHSNYQLNTVALFLTHDSHVT